VEPLTKSGIIRQLQLERRRLLANLENIPAEAMLIPGVVGESSVKDILAHLAEWEEHMQIWVEAARTHNEIEMPEAGTTWQKFNEVIYERNRHRPLEEVMAYFHDVHRQFMQMVEEMPEDEMLTPAYYPFTGKAAIVNWLKSYANHDLWAKTHIRKWQKKTKSKAADYS
jgi:hypothetical protein